MSRGEPNYTRREFLKYFAKIGAGAGAGAVVGGFTGRGVDYIIRAYERIIKNPVIKGGEKLEKARGRFWRKVLRMDNYQKGSGSQDYDEGSSEEESITRRGFFKKLLDYIYRNPVEAGVITGAAYGGGKTAITGYNKARTNIRIAQQDDQITQQNKRIKELEDAVGGLEEKIKGTDMIILGGILGILFSVAFSFGSITGNVISISNSSKSLIGTIIFILSITFLFAGIRTKKLKYNKLLTKYNEN